MKPYGMAAKLISGKKMLSNYRDLVVGCWLSVVGEKPTTSNWQPTTKPGNPFLF
jgi:hypothetical protein